MTTVKVGGRRQGIASWILAMIENTLSLMTKMILEYCILDIYDDVVTAFNIKFL